MIAFDTNFLVRLVVEDDRRQLAEVQRVLRDAEASGETCLLTDAVLCELEWVLSSLFGATRQEILTAVQRLAAEAIFCFESEDCVRRALDAYEAGSGDLSDYLIGFTGADHGARTTFTFDRALGRDEGFTVLRER